VRSVLLEFLKFRVLAAQDSFFAESDPRQRREWLSRVHPQALVLSDSDLDQVWAQAAELYGCH
jgi:hypothetical protein